jgi:hypothetical protein
MLKQLAKPILFAVAGLIALVAIAGLIGGNRPKPQAADAAQAQPAAAQEVPTPAPAADAAPAPSTSPSTATAAPVAAGMPPALPLDAATQPGALEVVEHVASGGEATEVSRRQLSEQALAMLSAAAAKDASGPAGWSIEGGAVMRVTRSGLVRIDAPGRAAIMLSMQSGGMYSKCRAALGDAGNVIAEGRGEQVAAAELLPGWHRFFLILEHGGQTETRCRLAIKPAGADAAAVADFHMPQAQAVQQ